MSTYTQAWLPMLKHTVPAELKTPAEVAAYELNDPAVSITVKEEMGDSYLVTENSVTGGRTGVLYGAYRMIMAKGARVPLPDGLQKPCYDLRVINCWDNMDGTVERGYAGRSLWFQNNAFSYEPDRIRMLGRLMASVGLNVLCINNVNVREPAQELIGDLLPELADFAAILRPFGVRVMVSVDFSSPMRHGIPTADPLDERVRGWWNSAAARMYAAVPDLAGVVVKADSEHRPGPFTYGRTHADGANMIAEAIAPYGGTVFWRCFVYNCKQDWRDTTVDRVKAAYDHFKPLDGQFAGNVILQVKNGPYDFQIREPVTPLFYAMPNTRLGVEFQLAQEYTGQQIDLYTMAPMWREFFGDVDQRSLSAIVAVSNLGRSDCFTGHPLALCNLFGYGLLSWMPDITPDAIVSLWARLTYDLQPDEHDALCGVMLASRDIYESYAGQLGMCWMITPNSHYGPNPDGYEYQSWGTYHKADRNGVGIDRTAYGTGYVLQYPEWLQKRYDTREACPDKMLLFFHRVNYTDVMRDGRTVIQRIYDDHFDGYEAAKSLRDVLVRIRFPEPDRTLIVDRAEQQVLNAREWCDVTNSFFYRFSGIEDNKGRKLW